MRSMTTRVRFISTTSSCLYSTRRAASFCHWRRSARCSLTLQIAESNLIETRTHPSRLAVFAGSGIVQCFVELKQVIHLLHRMGGGILQAVPPVLDRLDRYTEPHRQMLIRKAERLLKFGYGHCRVAAKRGTKHGVPFHSTID